MEELVRAESTVITYTDYGKYKAELDAELQKSAESFVKIGYLLKVARDTGILKESGYANVNEFAQREYGLDKTQVSRFMNINDKFSKDGYSEELREEYRGYGYAKLSIMLLLPEEVNEMLTTDLSKSEIQTVREEIIEEAKKTDIEVMLEGQDEVQQSIESNLEKVIYQIGHDDPDLYIELYGAKDIREIKEIMMPDGYKMYSIRVRGIGRMMLSLDEGKGIQLFLVRDNSREVYEWEQLVDAVHAIMLPDRTPKQSWEEFYNETMPEKEEVAPVQPKQAPRKESKVVVTPQKTEPKVEKPEPKEEKMPEPAEIPNAEPDEKEGAAVEEDAEKDIVEGKTDAVDDTDETETVQPEGEVQPVDREDGPDVGDKAWNERRRHFERRIEEVVEDINSQEKELAAAVAIRAWNAVKTHMSVIADDIRKIEGIESEMDSMDAGQISVEDILGEKEE